MSLSPERKGTPNVIQTSPNLGDDVDLLETKLVSNNNIINNLLHQNSASSSLDNTNPTQTLLNLSSEMQIHRQKQEILSQQIKSSKLLYNQKLKQYKSLIQSIIQLENNLDNIHLKITSSTQNQSLILNSITEDNFQYLLGIIPRVKNEIYAGFLSFINYDGYKGEQLIYILKSKTNLINLLENAFAYLKLMFSLSKSKYYNIRNKIAMIQTNNDNNIDFPFEMLYDYFKHSFDVIDQTEEYNIMQKKVNDLNNDKNQRFMELKTLENEILKKDLTLQNIITYVNNINTLIDKTQNANNKEILNHKLLNGFNDFKTEDNKSNTNEECVHLLANTNNHNSKTIQKRNVNNLQNNLNRNQKHSFLTHTSMFTNANSHHNVFNNIINSQTFSATVKIKPIATLSLKNNNSNHKKKKSDIQKKHILHLTNPTVVSINSSQKTSKKQTKISKRNTIKYHSNSLELKLNNLVAASFPDNKLKKDNKPKTPINNKVNNASNNIIINFKPENIEQIKLTINHSEKNTQSSCTTSMNTTINKTKIQKCKNNNNGRNKINSHSNKNNSTKNVKTRNNSSFTKQLLIFKKQPNQNTSKHFKPTISINSTDNTKIELENNNDIFETKNGIHKNNITDQSENYHINTHSKDSLNISDINSVCDELQVTPLTLFPGSFSNSLFVSNNTNTISPSVNNNNNNNYMQNSYILMQRNRDLNSNNFARKGIPTIKNNYINFKIEKPISSGGCCVSCT